MFPYPEPLIKPQHDSVTCMCETQCSLTTHVWFHTPKMSNYSTHFVETYICTVMYTADKTDRSVVHNPLVFHRFGEDTLIRVEEKGQFGQTLFFDYMLAADRPFYHKRLENTVDEL